MCVIQPEGVVLGETIKGKVKAGEISEAIGLAESACPGLFEVSFSCCHLIPSLLGVISRFQATIKRPCCN